MKTLRYFIILFASLSIMFFLIGCATAGKSVVRNVESIDFDLDPSIPAEEYGFLWYKEYIDIIRIDGKPDEQRVIFTPGFHTLEVQYFRTSSASGGSEWNFTSDVIPVSFIVERGKKYYLD
jgi:hypothetical protein